MRVASDEGGATVKLSIVVPLFNEGESLGELYAELRKVLDALEGSWEIVFVDDGSTDTTSRLLSALREKDSRVHVAGFAANRGLSAALSEGFSASRGRIVISMDGDLQFDPADILHLLEALDSADVVCGRRELRKDGLLKRGFSSLAYVARSVVLGDRIHDAGCTFRAYRRGCVANLALQPGHHRFLPYILQQSGFHVIEMPVSHRPRRYGRSKFGLARLFDGCATLLSLRFRNDEPPGR